MYGNYDIDVIGIIIALLELSELLKSVIFYYKMIFLINCLITSLLKGFDFPGTPYPAYIIPAQASANRAKPHWHSARYQT